MRPRCDEAPCSRAGRWAFRGQQYCLRHVTERFTVFAEGIAARMETRNAAWKVRLGMGREPCEGLECLVSAQQSSPE